MEPDEVEVVFPFSAAKPDWAIPVDPEDQLVGWGWWLVSLMLVRGVWQRDRFRSHLCWAEIPKRIIDYYILICFDFLYIRCDRVCCGFVTKRIDVLWGLLERVGCGAESGITERIVKATSALWEVRIKSRGLRNLGKWIACKSVGIEIVSRWIILKANKIH